LQQSFIWEWVKVFAKKGCKGGGKRTKLLPPLGGAKEKKDRATAMTLRKPVGKKRRAKKKICFTFASLRHEGAAPISDNRPLFSEERCV